MSPTSVQQIIDRLDSHSEKIDAIRRDLDRILGGVAVIGFILGAGLLAVIFNVLGGL
jgi:hypothetical protein